MTLTINPTQSPLLPSVLWLAEKHPCSWLAGTVLCGPIQDTYFVFQFQGLCAPFCFCFLHWEDIRKFEEKRFVTFVHWTKIITCDYLNIVNKRGTCPCLHTFTSTKKPKIPPKHYLFMCFLTVSVWALVIYCNYCINWLRTRLNYDQTVRANCDRKSMTTCM